LFEINSQISGLIFKFINNIFQPYTTALLTNTITLNKNDFLQKPSVVIPPQGGIHAKPLA